jgi:hypothetical protein
MLPAFAPRRRLAPPPSGARVDWGNPLNASLLGCWLPGAEGAARSTNLVSGRSAFRATTGVTAAAGRYGQAGAFDGTVDAHLTCGTLGAFPAALTLEALVYLPDALESGAFIKVGSGQQGYGMGVGNGTFDSDGNELLALREFVGWIDTNVTIGTGWHHVASAYTVSGGAYVGWVDGVRVTSGTFAGINTGNTDTFVGGYTGDGSENRHGAYRIALARVYGRQLNDAEVRALAAAPFATLVAPRSFWLGGLDASAAAYDRSLAGSQPTAAATLLARLNALSRPDADGAVGGWTTHLGGTTNLYQVVDEAAADDADYVQSGLDPTADTLILSLGALTDAGVSDANSHRLRFRYRKPAGDAARVDLAVTVQAGATDVATRTFEDIPDDWTEGLVELTAGEVGDFRTNGGYADPRLKLSATQV